MRAFSPNAIKLRRRGMVSAQGGSRSPSAMGSIHREAIHLLRCASSTGTRTSGKEKKWRFARRFAIALGEVDPPSLSLYSLPTFVALRPCLHLIRFKARHGP